MRIKNINNRVNNNSSVANTPAKQPSAPAKPAAETKPAKPQTKPAAPTAAQKADAEAIEYIRKALVKNNVVRLEISEVGKKVFVTPQANLDKKEANRARFSISKSAAALGMKWVEATTKSPAHYEGDRTRCAALLDGKTPAAKQPADTKPSKPSASKPKTKPAPAADEMITVAEAKAKAAAAFRFIFGDGSIIKDDKINDLINRAFAV